MFDEQNPPPVEKASAIIFKSNNEPSTALMTISKEQGTVGIELGPNYVLSLVSYNQQANKAWGNLHMWLTQGGASEPPCTSDQVTNELVKLIEGSINAFHQHAYAVANQNNPEYLASLGAIATTGGSNG